MGVANTNRSIPELLTDVVNNFTVLVRKETQLARVEMSEKIGDLAIGQFFSAIRHAQVLAGVADRADQQAFSG